MGSPLFAVKKALNKYSQTAMYASGAGLGASKGKDITKVAGMDYAGLAKESVSTNAG